MSSTAAVADVIEAFKQRGFEFVGKTDDGWFTLRGRLSQPQGDKDCPCEVELDPTFVDLPRIRLLEIPPELPAAVPHLGADGGLCYLAKGAVVLDIYDPVGQSLACLQRAAVVLRFFDDLSFAEVGEALGCPEATARSHVHRALARLRSELGEEDR